jgi:SAM-dependent methyltransferase
VIGETQDAIRRSYDRIAGDYAGALLDELRSKPFDRAALDRFAAEIGRGPVCDLGCGPGQAARHLDAAGSDMFGLDLSPGMIAEARRANPGIPFCVGDMLALPLPDASLGGAVAFYAIVNLPKAALPTVFGEIARALKPGGRLLMAFHAGGAVIAPGELWGKSVTLDFHFFDPAEIAAALDEAGFAIEGVEERDPYPEVEYQSRRAYIRARRGAAATS